ncbi:MAG: 1-acyl-sn-glycerol-3-phosphate acyltransferase [Alphaproteobacteria bacterium]|nr:1-acyl-sn-glycerol-3-phosphate acyltransferase [Alphaproteobacteria bacterium]
MNSTWRAGRRLLVYLAWTLLLIPVQLFAVAFGLRLAERLPRFYHRSCWRLLGIEVETHGIVSPARPTLFVANHSSYLDIIVLGGLVPASFVAKTEVADWPFFGTLARLQRSVLVDRRARSTATQRDALLKRLEAGDNLILFPEGTSNDGNRVLPFKSALFSVAERRIGGNPVLVQPVSVTYAGLDGMPLGYALRPLVAWYGDMDLGGHLWTLAGLGRLLVVVEFHPPVTVPECGSRRALAGHAHQVVAVGVARALTGRRLAPVAAA